MSEIKIVKDVLGSLYKLDVNAPVYIVAMKYVQHDRGVCKECNGERTFKHGNCVYKCAHCGGTGRDYDAVFEYVVAELECDGKYPLLEVAGDHVYVSGYYNVRGFFNNKNDAMTLVKQLNSVK